ncbi:MAG TPA: hypothetical protein PLX39_15410 [Pyrinomonadaceae bacterium]|nr:hypothetical protein [Pyrinomonadaceae bacterium]
MTKRFKLEIAARLIFIVLISLAVGFALGYERAADHARQMVQENTAK